MRNIHNILKQDKKPNKNKLILAFKKVFSKTFHHFEMFGKKLDKHFKSSILITYFKSLDFNKYFTKNISRNLKTLKGKLSLAHLFNGNSLKGNAMFSKKFKHDPLSSSGFCWVLLIAAVSVAILTGCGGGGGGSDPGVTPPVVTPPAVTVTYTATDLCASGPALTSTVSQAAANALVPNACPALPATAYAATTVASGSGTLTLTVTNLPAGFVNGVLTATGLASGGTWDVVATATGITVTPRAGAATDWATSYSGTLVMNFAGAPSASKNITFTTPAAPVTFAWPTGVKTLVEPAIVNGVLVSTNLSVNTWLALNPVEVSQNTTIIGGAKWNANLANGNVQISKSAEMAPDISGVQQNIWRANYTLSVAGNTLYCISPIFADTGLSYVNNNTVGTTCFTSVPIYLVGVSDSVTPANNGVIYAFMNSGNKLCSRNTVALGDRLVPCPF